MAHINSTKDILLRRSGLHIGPNVITHTNRDTLNNVISLAGLFDHYSIDIYDKSFETIPGHREMHTVVNVKHLNLK